MSNNDHAHQSAVRNILSTDTFTCTWCGLTVTSMGPDGGRRNHCPNCLSSLHVDHRVPGDRASDCRGRMEALSLTARADGEWMLIHQCLSCGRLSANRIAGDDNALALMRLALRPIQDGSVASSAMLAAL